MSSVFREVVSAAVEDFIDEGFKDSRRIDLWLARLREVIRKETPNPAKDQHRLSRALTRYYERSLSMSTVHKRHKGVPRFTIARIDPLLRAELTKRILLSSRLIVLNREQAVEKTLQRFAGWASSVPEGGSSALSKRKIVAHVVQPLRSQSYEERRLAIDQGQKLMASIDAVIAQQGGAIAAMWRSHWRQPNYDYRVDHKERDGKIYAIRDSYAKKDGLINKGDGYFDDMTQPGEEVFCRCYAVYLYNLRDLPEAMLTEKGRSLMKKTRIAA